MAQSHNAQEQMQMRAAAKLRERGGIYVEIPLDEIQSTKFARRWEQNAPHLEDFYAKNETFQNRLISELGCFLTKDRAKHFCWIIAAFAVYSGYLQLPGWEKLTWHPISGEKIPVQ